VLYLSPMLFLPRLYLSRVDRILECAEWTMKDMRHLVVIGPRSDGKTDCILVYFQDSYMSYPASMKFCSLWRCFIDSRMNEWTAFNIVSVLITGFAPFPPSNDKDADFSTSVPFSRYFRSIPPHRTRLSEAPHCWYSFVLR
jgi:hypothetical protein